MSKVILASASPRRQELLGKLGFPFEVIPSGAEENIRETEPVTVVEELSRMKALDVFGAQKEEDVLVIGADTIVAYQGQMMGKPENQAEAVSMLKRLSGNTHRVYTGVTLCRRVEGRETVRTFHECTEVTFFPLSEAEIQAYVQTGEPMDKAGAYGIQGQGALLVEKITGDYNNVVGLPVARLYREIGML